MIISEEKQLANVEKMISAVVMGLCLMTMESSYSQEFNLSCEGNKFRKLTDTQDIEAGARFSPKGNRIAFHSGQQGNRGVFTMDLDTMSISKLVDSEHDEAYPAWSPDGRYITYTSDQSGQFEIWKTPIEKYDPVQVTFTPKGALFSDWSPDGALIAYTRLTKDSEPPYSSEEGHIWVSTSNGRSPIWVTRRGGEWYPRWSADGSRILHYGNGGVWYVDLSNFEYRFILSSGDGFRPNWSPTDDWIVFSRTPGDHSGNQDLWLTSAKGGVHQAFNLTPGESVDDWAEFSPDGKRIVFTKIEDGNTNIWLLELGNCQ